MGVLRRYALAGTAGSVGLAYAASLFVPLKSSAIGLAQEILPIVVPMVCGLVCFRSARGDERRDRTSWVLLGAGAVVWGLGDLGYTLFDHLGIDPTGLTAADAGFLALIPLWMAALLLHPAQSRRGFELLGASLEALILFVAGATVIVAFVLAPALASADDVAGAIVNTAYPLGDLILFGTLLTVYSRSATRFLLGEWLVGAAIAVFAVGDMVYARLVLVDLYDVGHPVDLTWVAAFVLVIVAADVGLRGRARADSEMASVPLLTVTGIGALIALGLVAALADEQRSILLGGAAATGLLVAVRQATLLVERSRLVRALALNMRRLEEAQRARERLLATVSHDLRNPLAAISGFAELLSEQDVLRDPEQVQAYADSIKRNTRRLARLTEDLFAAGQFAAGHAPQLRVESLDLHATVVQAVQDLGYADDVRVEGFAVSVSVDAQRIVQVLGNLLDNALKHTSEPGGVVVRVGRTGEDAVLEVADAGTGIPPERINDIFEPFVSDFAGASSAGLGLYVVRNFVSAMGGRISVTSELGNGSTFRIVLPADDLRDLPSRAGRVA